MAWVRNLSAKGTTVHFCSPGDVVALPRTSNVHAYVLGPPKAEDELRRNLPTGAQRKAGEVYLRADSEGADRAFFAAVARQGLRAGHTPDAELQEQTLPFDPSQQVTPKAARRDHFFQHHYGFSTKDANAWRRINADWLDVAAELALWLDSSTNNTSLVLAIEIGAGGGTLIFAADAQIGNWISWFDVTFPNAADGTKVTATSLLARALLYKVGHHGSHNATLRKRGIEAMTRDDLVAMIPVNRASCRESMEDAVCADVSRAARAHTGPRPSLRRGSRHRQGHQRRGVAAVPLARQDHAALHRVPHSAVFIHRSPAAGPHESPHGT